jgi:PAS domain S-box-containing protein
MTGQPAMRDIFKPFTRWFAFLILFFYLSIFSLSQSYLVHSYSETDGLPSAFVYGITQDHQGRMWFATRAGIAVYDGVSWEKFTVSQGLPVPSFSKITEDQNNRIWALGSPGQGGIRVVYYENGWWNSLPGPGEEDFELSQTTSFALLEQAKQNTMPTIAVGTANQGILIRQQGKWKHLTQHQGLLSNAVNGIITIKGKFYTATDKGLSVIDSKLIVNNRLNRQLGLGPARIKGIAVQYKDKFPSCTLASSRVWLYGENWIGWFDEKNFKMTRYPPGLLLSGKKRSVNMLPDYCCGVYIGDLYLLNYFNYNTGSWQLLDTPNGLIGGGANSLYIDFEKNIWIACERGVSKISSRRFTSFQRDHGLLEDEVTALLEYEPGKFILGHNNGITFYDGKKFLQVPFSWEESALPVCRVLDIQMDANKDIWLAASWAGLAKVNLRSPHRITWYGTAHGLSRKIICLWIDQQTNRLWVGTEKGIFLRMPEHPTPQQKPEFVFMNIKELQGHYPRRIYGDSGKLRYIAGHNSGVFIYDEQNHRWKNYTFPDDENANAVYAITKDSSGRLLIGTTAGLFILENETLKKFKAHGFQVDRPVYFILEDHKMRLWFGTDNGVICRDGKKISRYSIKEGLIGHETNRAAAITDTRGRIWIGTNRGVSIYDETYDNSIRYNPPPKVQLFHVQVSGNRFPLNQNNPIQLSYQDNTLEFHFRGISFSDETAIRFKNKLEGFESEWTREHYPYQQMIRYINLPPGTYRFHIKARNALGVWSDEKVSPGITILNPFYRTWWFFLLAAILVGTIFYGMFQYLSQKRHASLLEKQVEERTHQLQAAEQQYRSLFEESKDVVFITSPEGKIIDMNPAGLQLFGYSSKEEAINANSVLEIYNNAEDRAAVREEIGKKGYVQDYEMVFKTKRADIITTLVTASLVRDKQGKITSYRGIIKDITRQKKLEERLLQAQKMEAIGTLAGGIAHDFNNILAVIMGQAELMRDDLTPGNQMHKKADSIVNAADRGAELVKQILTFSRQSKSIRKLINPGNIIKESLSLLRSILPSTIEMHQDIRADCTRLLADAAQIRQIVMNFGTNAAHAMREQGGVLEVKSDEVFLDAGACKKYHDIKPGTYLELTVSDTGHGMTREVMKRIFEPYFTTKKTGEGTGMGLAVTHGIVKSYGGDISVLSEMGKGTTFRVLLPCIRDTGEQHPEADTQLKEEIPCGNESILLVDDETEITETAKKILEKLGYHVVGKSSSKNALALFKKAPLQFDIIVSDLTMPHMTGLQLAREIKRIRIDIPIIILSGYNLDMTREQIKGFGVSDFISKPINMKKLARVVRRVLDKRQKTEDRGQMKGGRKNDEV